MLEHLMRQPYTNLILFIIAISTALLGLTIGLMGHHKHIELITDFYFITDFIANDNYNNIAAAGFILAALLAVMAIKQHKIRPILGGWLVIISMIPLLALFGQSMWIDSLGGFPAIGSGQGVIKYGSLLSLGLLLALPNLPSNYRKWISVAPVLLVLLWIGGMKFTLLEAKGIEDLVISSPFMAWMYHVWDLQTTSNLIGVYDLMAVALLIGACFNHRLLLPSIAMAGAVFVITQTFLISWDGAISTTSLLSTGGQFLIKDLWFIANLILFWQAARVSQQ